MSEEEERLVQICDPFFFVVFFVVVDVDCDFNFSRAWMGLVASSACYRAGSWARSKKPTSGASRRVVCFSFACALRY